ncbi:MAG: hypothetical protein ACW97O_16080 [Candidatus Thorarchaeota archaeon]|jgi:hypothetical protein
MALHPKLNLKRRVVAGGKVFQTSSKAWHLEIPSGRPGEYRLAQLDDYNDLSRQAFPWRPPLKLTLRGRASADSIPGTWGFGLWNDPFGRTLIKGTQIRLPTLPNAALSLRDDLPARGQLAATFQSPAKLPAGLILNLPLLPLIFLPPVGRWLRRQARRYVMQDTAGLDFDATEWHTYEIDLQLEGVIFRLDGQNILETKISPEGPLGLVIWVDNQYASLPPDGSVGYGTLANQEAAWIEMDGLKLAFAVKTK